MAPFTRQSFRPAPGTPLYQQLYAHLQAAILAGELAGGTRLPSTRALAEELRVSRNTVLNAYDQLTAEGYLEGLAGSGTFVARLLPDRPPAVPGRPPSPPPRAERPPTLSENARRQLAAPQMSGPRSARAGQTSRPFNFGSPDLEA